MAAIKSSVENIRQVNLSIYVMYIIYVMWMVAFMVVVSSKPTRETDIVTEILSVIDGREEMQTVVRYLNSSRDELIKEMPLFNSDGMKLNYTFFAPTSLAFLLQTPQDTVGPMFSDANFRLKVLIRHFARQNVSSNDLARLDRLVMADSNVAAITRSVDMKTLIDGAEIQAGLSSSFGVVHIVDRVFGHSSEVILPVIADAIAIEEPSVSPSPPIVDGFGTVSSSEIDTEDIATFITTSLSANLASPLVLLSVVKAETQMVAGVNYRLELKFKGQMESEQNTLIFCQVVVFHQPWTSTRHISSSKCNPPLAVTSVEIQ